MDKEGLHGDSRSIVGQSGGANDKSSKRPQATAAPEQVIHNLMASRIAWSFERNKGETQDTADPIFATDNRGWTG